MARIILLLVTVAFCNASPSDSREGKVVGGEDADISEFPYQVQLSVRGAHICGAAIISKDWVVTAAHCVDSLKANPESVTLRAGTKLRNKGGSVHQASVVIAHEEFGNMDYDIALIKVNQPFDFGPNVQPISLPGQGELVAPDTLAVVTGWGYLEPGVGSPSNLLQKVQVPIVRQASCVESYDKVYMEVTDRMICAGLITGGKDACQGDSGGPLAVDRTLVGVVSWGRSCAEPDFPGVYTRVAVLRDWIREHTGV